MRGTWIASAATVLAGLCAGCSTAPPPQLVGGAVSAEDQHLGIHETIGRAPRHIALAPDSYFCSPIELTVDEVTLDGATPNLRLVDWGIGSSGRFGDTLPPVTVDEALPGSSHTIRQPCNGPRYAAVVLELERTDDENAVVQGAELHYRVGDQAASVHVNAGIEMCARSCPDLP